MGWKHCGADYEAFERNTLEAVVAQLRFHPIFNLRPGLAAFQDPIRRHFPLFEEGVVREFLLNPAQAGARVTDLEEFRFLDATGDQWVTLAPHAVSLMSRRHTDRERFQRRFADVTSALNRVFDPVIPIRLGLRYVNRISRDRIQEELGRALDWPDLVAKDFLRLPIADELAGMEFHSEVRGPCDDGGQMVVRYGLVSDADGEGPSFHLDTDRFIEGEQAISDVPELLAAFSRDIYDVFRLVARPALLEWMRPTGGTQDA